jgi:K+ transport systems, NAD-binding component
MAVRRSDVAVVGLGRFGTSLCRALVENGVNVLGIDRDRDLVQRYSHEITQTVALDTTDVEALREVGIDDYNPVVVAIGDNFEASLMTCVALKAVKVRHVVCKAASLVHRDILRKVGADRVILPEHEGGQRLGLELARPGFLGQVELCADTAVTKVTAPPSLVGLTLEEAKVFEEYGLKIVAIVRGARAVPLPSKIERIAPGDELVVIGETAQPRSLRPVARRTARSGP